MCLIHVIATSVEEEPAFTSLLGFDYSPILQIVIYTEFHWQLEKERVACFSFLTFTENTFWVN